MVSMQSHDMEGMFLKQRRHVDDFLDILEATEGSGWGGGEDRIQIPEWQGRKRDVGMCKPFLALNPLCWRWSLGHSLSLSSWISQARKVLQALHSSRDSGSAISSSVVIPISQVCVLYP